MGWSGTRNGALLSLAAGAFDVLLTVDQSIPHQQNFQGLDLALVIVRAPSSDINDLRPKMPDVLRVLDTIRPGQVVHVGGDALPLATRMETRLPWRPTRGSLTSPSYLVRNRTLGPPLENNPEIPPSSRDEGLRLL